MKFTLLKLFKDNTLYFSVSILLLFAVNLISVFIPITSKNIIDFGFLKYNINAIFYFSIFFIFLFILKSIIEIIIKHLLLKISKKLKTNLFNSVFERLMHIKLDFYYNNSSSKILNDMNSDINNISNFLETQIVSILGQLFNLTGGLIGLFIINYKLSIIVLFFLPLKFFIILFFSSQSKKLNLEKIKLNSDFANWFNDKTDGIKEIRIYSLVKKIISEFSIIKKLIISKENNISFLNTVNIHVDYILTNLLTTIIYIVSGLLFIKRNITYGEIVAFISYVSFVTVPLANLINIKYYFSSISPSITRLNKFFEKNIENSGLFCPKNYNFILKLKNISFSYNNINIFKKLNLSIKEGEKVAILGANGVGKSTLIDLILRFQEPNDGSILLNEISVEKYDIQLYRNLFAVAFQKSHLFNWTVKNNIELGSEKDLNILYKNFNLDINENYDLMQNGTNISGGQKQKINILRALASNRPFIILDEPETNLDLKSQDQIKNIIKNLKNKTIILITHSDQWCNSCDKTLKLENNNIFHHLSTSL